MAQDRAVRGRTWKEGWMRGRNALCKPSPPLQKAVPLVPLQLARRHLLLPPRSSRDHQPTLERLVLGPELALLTGGQEVRVGLLRRRVGGRVDRGRRCRDDLDVLSLCCGPEQANQQLPTQRAEKGRLRTSSEVGSCKLGRVQELVQVALLRHRSQSSFIFFKVLCQAEDSQRGEGRRQRQREREYHGERKEHAPRARQELSRPP